jgi:hypothetical protein
VFLEVQLVGASTTRLINLDNVTDFVATDTPGEVRVWQVGEETFVMHYDYEMLKYLLGSKNLLA